MLDDVSVAPKRNVNGQVYGFVRYLKIRDVDKLVQALNNVWFGDLHLWDKVARFHRKVSDEGGKVVLVGERGQRGRRDDIGEGEKIKNGGLMRKSTVGSEKKWRGREKSVRPVEEGGGLQWWGKRAMTRGEGRGSCISVGGEA